MLLEVMWVPVVVVPDSFAAMDMETAAAVVDTVYLEGVLVVVAGTLRLAQF